MAKLYHFPLCVFSRRSRLTLGELVRETELVEERPWEQREDFYDLNPTGAVPVFVDDDETVVAGIEPLADYLDETRSPAERPSLFGESPGERAEARRLVAWFDLKFHSEVTLNLVFEKIDRRYMRASQGGGSPDMPTVRAGKENIKYHLDYIGHLIEDRNWLAGDRLSQADLAAAAHLSSIDYLGDVPWSVNEPAKAWYARIKSRPSFRPLLADHLTGMPPPEHYADLDF